MRRAGVWALVCVLVLTWASAYADRVHLKSGRTLEGEVIDRGDRVEIKLKLGSITVAKDEIASIEPVVDAAETYREKAAALGADDADGHFQLAQWCQMRGLQEQARTELAAAETQLAELAAALAGALTEQSDRQDAAEQALAATMLETQGTA